MEIRLNKRIKNRQFGGFLTYHDKIRFFSFLFKINNIIQP